LVFDNEDCKKEMADLLIGIKRKEREIKYYQKRNPKLIRQLIWDKGTLEARWDLAAMRIKPANYVKPWWEKLMDKL